MPVAASFACTCNAESLLDLLFVGTEAYCFTAGRGLGHTEQMLEVLASVQVCREKSFAAWSISCSTRGGRERVHLRVAGVG